MAEAKPTKNTKRSLRPASETMRQQAEKAQATADKPQGNRRLRSAASSAGKPLGRFAKLFHRQPFRFIGRILLPRFVRNAFKELRLVTWPNRKQTRDLTFAVLMFAIAFGIIITIVDYGLDKLFKSLILK